MLNWLHPISSRQREVRSFFVNCFSSLLYLLTEVIVVHCELLLWTVPTEHGLSILLEVVATTLGSNAPKHTFVLVGRLVWLDIQSAVLVPIVLPIMSKNGLLVGLSRPLFGCALTVFHFLLQTRTRESRSRPLWLHTVLEQ